MKYIKLLLYLYVCFILSGDTWCQENELVTKDDFIKKFSQSPPGPTSPKLKLRSISIQPKVPPEVTIYILFKFGSTALADEFSKKQLDEASQALSSDALSTYRFEIQGHTDAIGSESFNMKLSRERANTIKRFLIDRYGINEDRLVTCGFGESMPVAANDSEAGRAKNRRVVFRRLN